MNLSDTQIQYLLTLLRHSEEGSIRIKAVAGEMGVTPAAVQKRLDTFIRLGLVEKQKYRSVDLTPEGKKTAEHLRERYNVIYPFLHDTLSVDPKESQSTTLGFLGTMSEQSMFKLEEYIRFALGQNGTLINYNAI